MVLLAALILVVALIPLTVAYLQLGYTGDPHTSLTSDAEQESQRLLERTVQNATSDTPVTYRWDERRTAVKRVHERLKPTADTLEQSRLTDGIARGLTYNQSRADNWADRQCPRGPGRQFGRCKAIDGVVVQQRAGRTHVLAVVVDLSTTAPNHDSTLTMVIRAQTR